MNPNKPSSPQRGARLAGEVVRKITPAVAVSGIIFGTVPHCRSDKYGPQRFQFFSLTVSCQSFKLGIHTRTV